LIDHAGLARFERTATQFRVMEIKHNVGKTVYISNAFFYCRLDDERPGSDAKFVCLVCSSRKKRRIECHTYLSFSRLAGFGIRALRADNVLQESIRASIFTSCLQFLSACRSAPEPPRWP
jgi:hypothetical protein